MFLERRHSPGIENERRVSVSNNQTAHHRLSLPVIREMWGHRRLPGACRSEILSENYHLTLILLSVFIFCLMHNRQNWALSREGEVLPHLCTILCFSKLLAEQQWLCSGTQGTLVSGKEDPPHLVNSMTAGPTEAGARGVGAEKALCWSAWVPRFLLWKMMDEICVFIWSSLWDGMAITRQGGFTFNDIKKKKNHELRGTFTNSINIIK